VANLLLARGRETSETAFSVPWSAHAANPAQSFNEKLLLHNGWALV